MLHVIRFQKARYEFILLKQKYNKIDFFFGNGNAIILLSRTMSINRPQNCNPFS